MKKVEHKSDDPEKDITGSTIESSGMIQPVQSETFAIEMGAIAEEKSDILVQNSIAEFNDVLFCNIKQ